MTNEQLALLLKQYAARLDLLIAVAIDDLPADALTTGKYAMGGEFVYAPALEPLKAFAKEIEESAKALETIASKT